MKLITPIIQAQVVTPKDWWVNKRVSCSKCKAVTELESKDVDLGAVTLHDSDSKGPRRINFLCLADYCMNRTDIDRPIR